MSFKPFRDRLRMNPRARLRRGTLYPCSACGRLVVHWSDGTANHAHRWSKRCEVDAAQLDRDLAAAKTREERAEVRRKAAAS